MSGDYSRLNSRKWPLYAATLLQQGRPLTDRDWNELAGQLSRRIHADKLDTSGPVSRSAVTPNGFALSIDASGDLLIGRGRLYVDGLLVENHGAGVRKWDSLLAEEHGDTGVRYSQQPSLPNAPALPQSGGPYPVFLDVWQREVTHILDPDLVEAALGVDTTTRVQNVWQVKIGAAGANVACATPLGFKASSGRLTTATGDVPGDANPCLIPPSGGYRGLENQLYRIEIHKAGAFGTATFKWSRDNASVETRVTELIDDSHLVVESVGRDDVLRFSDGDWIEITDDWREFAGEAGVLRRIKTIDDTTREITLDAPLTGSPFPLGKPDAQRHMRIRRWDQKGKVLDQNGHLHVDLDAPGSTGAIPITAGVSVLLENGVLATFTIDADTTVGDQQFHIFDTWSFYARTNDATIEKLDAAPPRGIHHRYVTLGLFTPPSGIETCIVETQEHGDCCCIVVAASAEASDAIQKAIDSLPNAGGCVCLKAGLHRIKQTIIIQRSNVTLVGETIGARIELEGSDALLAIVAPAGKGRISGIEISTIAFRRLGSGGQGNPIVGFSDADESAIEDCVITGPNDASGLFAWNVSAFRAERCTVESVWLGIAVLTDEASADIRIADNNIEAGETDQTYGILVGSFGDDAGLMNFVTISGNAIRRCSIGIGNSTANMVDIADNVILSEAANSFGIYCHRAWYGRSRRNQIGTKGVAIASTHGWVNRFYENAIGDSSVGIGLMQEVAPACAGNEIHRTGQAGILVIGIYTRFDVCENSLLHCGFATAPHCGIVVIGAFGELQIKGNEIINAGIAVDGKQASEPVEAIAAILVQGVTVEGNVVSYFNAMRPTDSEDRALYLSGLGLVQWSAMETGFPVLISGNRFTGSGRTALVELPLVNAQTGPMLFERVLFSNNYCFHFTQPNDSGATVMLRGRGVTATGNQIKATTPGFRSMEFNGMKGTCIGNITSGTISGITTPAGVGFNVTMN
jgi:hypothetical protein